MKSSVFRKTSLVIALFLLSLPLSAKAKVLRFERLDQQWELYIQKTPEQVQQILSQNGTPDAKVWVPGFWNKAVQEYSENLSPRTYGTYRLKLTELSPSEKYGIFIMNTPGTSCSIYVNGIEYATNGNPFAGFNSTKVKPKDSIIKPIYFDFFSDALGNADIQIFVNNHFYRKSGLWDSVIFGTSQNVKKLYNIMLIFHMLMSGILLFIGLLNIIQFIINKDKKEYLWLGITAIVFSFRISTTDFCAITTAFPFINAAVKYKLEYMSNWLVPLSILKMLCVVYPVELDYIIFKSFKEKYLREALYIFAWSVGAATIILPISIGNKLVTLSQICLGLFAIYVIALIVVNIIKRKPHTYFYLFSCTILIIGGGFSVIYSKNKTFLPFSIFPVFLVIFIFIQLLLLATIQNDIYKETIDASENLKKLNEAYLRFVPREFLKLLNKDSITNIQIGDHSNIEMSIMFSKLNISCENDDCSQEEHFLIFNQFLQTISPIIKNNNGFVSKFLSGGFMALFPQNPVDAVKTAIEIQSAVNQLNKKLKAENSDNSISSKIGIHYGKMVIGTIGEENRLDDTVISDTVNTVSRIESVCERLNKNIILSENQTEKIKNEDLPDCELIELESIAVKGKQQPLKLFECKGAAE